MEKCVICGNDFYPEYYGQETCSGSCEILKNNMEETLKEKTCIVCGNKFIPNSNNQQICSEGCREYRRNKVQEKYYDKQAEKSQENKNTNNAKKGTKNTLNYKLNGKECIICGKKFIAKNAVQLCCSKECSKIRKKQRNKEYSRKRREKNKKLKECKKECVICGKTFTTTYNHQITCSKVCGDERNRRIKYSNKEKTKVEKYNEKWKNTKVSKITDYEHFTRIKNIDIGDSEELEYIIKWNALENRKYEAVTSIGLFRRVEKSILHDNLYYRWNINTSLDRLKKIKDTTLNDKELNYYHTIGAIELFEMIEDLGGGN